MTTLGDRTCCAAITGGLMALEPRAWLTALALLAGVGLGASTLLGLDRARRDLHLIQGAD